MRALEADTEGFVDRDGVKLHYEVFGDGRPTLLLLPAWSMGAQWALWLTAHHPERVLGNVFIGPDVDRWCARAARPALVVHGDRDRISPPRSGAALARATGGSLLVLEGAGHIPNARDPVRVNRLIREFAESLPARGPA
jgi:pimeloyl-ACP methyl ester carboxylesterase